MQLTVEVMVNVPDFQSIDGCMRDIQKALATLATGRVRECRLHVDVPRLVSDEEEKERNRLHGFKGTLSVRARKFILRLGVSTIQELLNNSRKDLLEKRNCGPKTVNEIENKLRELGYALRSE